MADNISELRDKLIPDYFKETGGWDASNDPSLIDTTLGILNRNGLEELGPRQIELSKRDNVPLSLMIIDADNFKEINDSLGHIVVDEKLKASIGLLKVGMRMSDYIFRFGGDEFVIIMPGITPRQVRKKIEEKVRSAFAANQLYISVGISQLRKNDRLNNLIGRADKEMYKEKVAKKNG